MGCSHGRYRGRSRRSTALRTISSLSPVGGLDCKVLLRRDDGQQRADDGATRAETRQPMAARQAVPEIERQRGFPGGDGFTMVAGPEMTAQHTGDQRRELVAPRAGQLGKKRNDPVLAPGEPWLEMMVAGVHGGGE